MPKSSKRLREIKALSKVTLDIEEHASKKRKTKNPDPAYRPLKKATGKSKNNMLAHRFNRKKTVTTETHTTPKKTSTLIRHTPIKASIDKETARLIDEKIAESVDTHTPVKSIDAFSKTGTPQKITSSSGTMLNLLSNNGILYFFTNETVDDIKTDQTIKPDFATSSPAKKVKEAKATYKTVQLTISKELLKKVSAQIKQNKGKRVKSQNSIMGDSATKYSHAAGISLKSKAEWGHLIAHRFLSDIAQHEKNLVAMTDFSNSEMLTVEDIIALLIEQGSQDITISAKAYLINATQLAEKIEYTVSIGEHQFPFVFSGQQLNKPDIANHLIMKAFFSALINRKILAAKKSDTTHDLDTQLPHLIFSKSKNSKACATKPKIAPHKKSSIK